MSGVFITPFDVRLIASDPEYWELLCDLVFDSSAFGQVTAKAGFVTNCASVPRIPVAFLLLGGYAKKPSALHDHLYSFPGEMTREQCDKIFLEAMKADGVSAWRRNAMYIAVRAFGGKHFVTGKIRE